MSSGGCVQGAKSPLRVQSNSFSNILQFEKLASAGRKYFFDTLKSHAIPCGISRGFLSTENHTLGVGGSEAFRTIKQEKTPLGVRIGLRSGNCKQNTKKRTFKMTNNLNETHSLSHTKWNCKYHVVFAPRYRRKAFYGHRGVEIGAIVRKLCAWNGGRS